MSRSTFCHTQRVYHIPAIIYECWAKNNNQLGITNPKCWCLWVMASVTLLGVQPRVLMEMTTGYTIDLEVLNKREVVNMKKKTAPKNILLIIINVVFCC